MKIKDANGIEGHLIYMHGADKYMFRVYNGASFIDYDIRHCDLCVKITDPDAAFYIRDDGTEVLDHSPETLGIVKE
jgi:hypothetical protein